MDTKNARVKFKGLTVDLLKILPVIEETHRSLTGRGAVITSLNDGLHAVDSKHYEGNAVDLRVWYTDELAATQRWATTLAVTIGPDYDVVYGDMRHLDHIHVEYDPKPDYVGDSVPLHWVRYHDGQDNKQAS